MPARRSVRLALAAALLALPRSAAAVCTAQEIIAAEAACPPTGFCTISRTHPVGNGCTLDFGTRTVTLSGQLVIGSGAMSLRAGNLSLSRTGFIDAIGVAPGAHGGTVVIETTAGFTTLAQSRIDASGSSADSAGAIMIRAGTFMALAGRLQADFARDDALGGMIDLDATGDITISPSAVLSARGGSNSNGGGEIDLSAGGNIAATDTTFDVSAYDGGFVEMRAGGTVTLKGANASATGDAGSGGCIDVVGGAGTTLLGSIVADGSTGSFMSGGCGGLICLDGDTGPLDIRREAHISASGASPDGGGGQVALLSLAAIVVNGTIEARGPMGGVDFGTCGGDICIEPGLDATIGSNATLDASGSDDGGTVDVIAGRDLTVHGVIKLQGREQGGIGGDLALRAGNSGTGQLLVTGDVDVSSAASCAAGGTCGEAGSTELFGCNVTVAATANLVATGPFGGEHALTAREQLQVSGVIDASRTTVDGTTGTTRLQYPSRKTPTVTGAGMVPTPVRLPLTTCPMQGPSIPPCLDPCPVCGNGQVEFPEACDQGVMPPQSCGGCSRFCQLENCDDTLTCTADTCVPSVGCRHAGIPDCTEPPTPTRTVTNTRPTATSTPTATHTRSATPTPSASPTASPANTPTGTGTATPTATASETRTTTPTATATDTGTRTPSASATATATDTPSASPSATTTSTAAATDTPTPVHTLTPSNTPTPVDTATAASTPTTPAPTCPGDCNGDGTVAINELITGVNIALGSVPAASCPSFDRNGDGEVSINELIAAVNAALAGC